MPTSQMTAALLRSKAAMILDVQHTRLGAAQPMTADRTVMSANAETAPAYTCSRARDLLCRQCVAMHDVHNHGTGHRQ